jgi:hypothetical protein
LTLEVPDWVTLLDGTTAEVKAVAARVIDGRLTQIVYSIERASGAWADVPSDEVQPEPAAKMSRSAPNTITAS